MSHIELSLNALHSLLLIRIIKEKIIIIQHFQLHLNQILGYAGVQACVFVCVSASVCVWERERLQGTFFPTHFRQQFMPHVISLNFGLGTSLFESFLRSCIITSSHEFLKLFLWNVITHVMPFLPRTSCAKQKERNIHGKTQKKTCTRRKDIQIK